MIEISILVRSPITNDKKSHVYVKIKNKKIIKELCDIIEEDSYIPQKKTGHFSYSLLLTVKTKKKSITSAMGYYIYDDTIPSRNADIILLKNSDIDINTFQKYYFNEKLDKIMDLIWERTGYIGSCYTIRSSKLYDFLNKYVITYIKEVDKDACVPQTTGFQPQ